MIQEETQMRRQLVAIALGTLLLGGAGLTARAQPNSEGSGFQMQQAMDRGPERQYDADDDDDGRDDWRRREQPDRGARMGEGRGGRMMEGRRPEMMGERRQGHYSHHRGPASGAHGMMGPQMMGPHMGRAPMMGMMMVLMDLDGDGAVSLQEYLAGHERIFKAMDADKDGRLTLDEIRNFRPGLRGARPPQQPQ